MRATPLTIIALAWSLPVAAHDFWIQPSQFIVAPGAPLSVTLLVGHGTARQRWGVAPARVLRFSEITAAGTTDRRALLHTDSGDSDASLRLTAPGTHVFVLESNHAQSTLPALRFNDYLKVEGLTPALEFRARTKSETSDGREIYSRAAKTLILVAGTATPQPHVTRPAGLKLEIVPQRNPYDLKPGEALPIQILYGGKPLPGATVKLNNLDFDARPLAAQVTGTDGTTSFTVPLRGRWQMNVIWTRPLTGNAAAEFDTTFSSLSFGFDAAPPASRAGAPSR